MKLNGLQEKMSVSQLCGSYCEKHRKTWCLGKAKFIILKTFLRRTIMSKKLIHLISFVLVLGLFSDAGAQPTGEILWEYWYDIGGTGLGTLRNDPRYPDNPDATELRDSFDSELDAMDNYGCRVRGYLYPPADGDYEFWVSGDDNCELRLGTNEDPSTAIKICEVPGWTNQYEWTKYVQQKSTFITLQAGKKYYIEGLMKEGDGGDSLTGAWGGPVIGQGPEVIDGAYLSPWLGWSTAHFPNPANGALVMETWASISWAAGETAVSHDVYFSGNYDDVKDGTADAFIGNQTQTDILVGFAGHPYPEGLEPGSTYYWRIDEVEANGSKHPGQVWSFSIPPRTAYDPDPADGAEFVDVDVTLSWTAGFKAKLHTVYFGTDFDEIANASGGFPGGLLTYNPGLLETGKVYYWRVDEFDPPNTYKGDVWRFTTPGAVGNPQPADNAADVEMNAILSWTAADGAASHEIYFGTDEAIVRSADTGSPEYKGSKTLGSESHDAGLIELDTTYYWRVDKVDAQGNVSKGPVWTFTTGSHLLIDDFEGYTDDDAAGQAIWQTWIDGFGIADNGAQVGYLMPPYAEQTVIHGGLQSMPLLFTNEGGITNSEASMTLTAPRDWTMAGVAELSLWFRGDPGNAANPLYVAVSNSTGAPAVVAYDDPADIAGRKWVDWRIATQAIADQGINLTNVDKIAIGLGSKAGLASPGGSGTVYIDDIRLYRP